ncbi:M23 family metallopeptidase [Rhodococcus spongiicola]|uniref:M23 family metallopeptidase n=1 Tax=Rhodococcus spongiicola TaxID=2487352 RepID=A0A3S3ALY6_9NOCA|nr:M23 family metallopeptidase [Rhodococcus spongiicola]RVW03775.1 M23 family metallopeptidase [Rhodococcus spongiicola]
MGSASRIITRIGVVLTAVVVSSSPAAAGPARAPAPPQVVAFPGDAVRATYDWPLHPRPRVVRSFDKPAQNWLPGHRGVDLAAAPGQRVLAAGAGTVVFAGAVAGRPVVSVDHPGGLRTTYEPVEPSVTAGRRVGRGDLLGTVIVGHPECAATACLHWGLRRDREYLDPLPLVRAVPIRLLPTGTGQARG